MKGMVLRGLVEHMESAFGLDVADKVLLEADLPSGGAYTTVGVYDHAEVLEIVTHLSRHTGVDGAVLVDGFGEFLFPKLVDAHPEFLEDQDDLFTFLEGIEGIIHVNVRRLYPEAELPRFACARQGDGQLMMEYQSHRPFAGLVPGLIRGASRHFGEVVEIDHEPLPPADGTHARFTLTRRSG